MNVYDSVWAAGEEFGIADFGMYALSSLVKEKAYYAWEVDAEDVDVCSGEPAYDGDNVIGVTTSGSYGHTVGKSLAFAYVSPEYAVPGTTFAIEILSNRCQAKVLAEAANDPKNKRLRS